MSLRRTESKMALKDWLRHPVWEYALDEEGDAASDETVMRPFEGRPVPVDLLGKVRTTCTTPDGAELVALLTPAGRDPQTGEPRPHAASILDIRYRQSGDKARASLHLGRENPDDPKRTERARKAALTELRTTEDKLFPLRVRPAEAVEGYPEEWVLEGFVTLTADGSVRFLRAAP